MSTGWIWDERYMWHDAGRRGRSDPGGRWIEPEDQAESPATKRRLRNLVDVSGLLARLVAIAPREASREELVRCHSAEYVDAVREASARGGGDAGENATFAPGGYEIAALAAGGAIAAAEAVLAGAVANAYALVRPPGHHAERARGRGYCIFANVAIAARHLQERHGVGRIAIVDWDVHHGNGAQKLFWEDSSVLTVSLHQDRYYPVESGAVDEIGEGAGRGYNVNVPLPAGCGVGAYLHALEQVVDPVVRSFGPEIVLVSCGFDASALEPQGQMMVHSDGFRMMTELVMASASAACGGRIVFCHEGGYSTVYVPFCGLAVLETLAGCRTAVLDPYLERFAAMGGQELGRHQAAAIEAARRMVRRVGTLQID